jgi:hypothetical protein
MDVLEKSFVQAILEFAELTIIYLGKKFSMNHP